MKSQVLALAVGLGLAIAGSPPVNADDISDALSGATTLQESQLKMAKGSAPAPALLDQTEGQSGLFGPGGGTTSPGGLGGVATGQAGSLAGSTGSLGTNTLSPVSTPINVGLGVVGDHIGVGLPTLPQ